MLRKFIYVLALLAAGSACAGETEFQRGEYAFSVGPEPAFVVRHEISTTWDPAAPGVADERWRYWLYDYQVDRRDVRGERYVEQVYEPTSASMLGDAGRFQVSFNPEYQQLQIHRVEVRRGGVWQDRLLPEKISLARRESDFEQDLANGEVSALIVLEDVRVNDLVRVAYTISGGNPILHGQMADWAHLGWGSPVLDVYLRVLAEPGTRFATHLENGAPDALVTRLPTATEAKVHVHGAMPVVDDGSYPAWHQPYPLVQIAEEQRWADVVAWALPLYPAVDALPAELETRIADWSRLDDPFERVRVALRAVQDEVRYFGAEMGENTHRPNPPGTTWSRRYGDCKDKVYLLVALLGRLGVDAAPALVSTDRGRALLDFVPSASVFNHVIVRARVGDSVMWLDPTVSQQGGDPRDSDLGGYGVALPVEAGTKALEVIEPTRDFASGVSVVERYRPEDDGPAMTFDVNTVYRGRSADDARRRLVNARPQELSRQYADYYRRRLGRLSVLQDVTITDDRRDNVVTVTEQYRLASPFESEGPHQQAIDIFAQALDAPMALPEGLDRTTPVAFSRPARFEHRITMETLPGWTPTFQDESAVHASPAFTYARDISIDGGLVQIEYTLEAKAPEVLSKDVGTHLRALDEARDNLSARLRFRVSPESGPEGRSARLKALLRDVMDNGDVE